MARSLLLFDILIRFLPFGRAMLVRRANHEDLTPAKELLQDSGLPSDHLDRDIQNLFIVEDNDGRVGGCACLCIGQPTELRSVCIRPDLRGKGWGRQLVGVVLTEAKETGIAKVYLRTEATGIFERFGFSELPKHHLMKWRYCSKCPRLGTKECRHVPMVWKVHNHDTELQGTSNI